MLIGGIAAHVPTAVTKTGSRHSLEEDISFPRDNFLEETSLSVDVG